MDVRNESVEHGVVEQAFVLETADDTVPGIFWCPEGATEARPTILLGHGGTQDKRAPNVLGLARRFVRHLGFCAVAIDAPGHGDRIVDHEAFERQRRALQERIAAGPDAAPRAFEPAEAAAWVERTRKGVAEWKALLDDLESHDATNGRYGYWGVSMGTIIGLPFVATEPRIAAAVLGLAGLGGRPGDEEFEAHAHALKIPVLLVEQWDDELMSRESMLALFDAIGSKDKAMHLHPGGHVEIPLYERDAYDAFFARHLAE